MKYRVIWNTATKVVLSVIQDQGGTITNYPDVDREFAVVANLDTIKGILVAQSYDVTVIDDYIIQNN